MTGVKGATKTGYLPTSGWRSDSPLFQDPVPDQKTALSLQIWT
jgi:putative ABC transport system permease protein